VLLVIVCSLLQMVVVQLWLVVLVFQMSVMVVVLVLLLLLVVMLLLCACLVLYVRHHKHAGTLCAHVSPAFEPTFIYSHLDQSDTEYWGVVLLLLLLLLQVPANHACAHVLLAFEQRFIYSHIDQSDTGVLGCCATKYCCSWCCCCNKRHVESSLFTGLVAYRLLDDDRARPLRLATLRSELPL
jgi:hypothetical protein